MSLVLVEKLVFDSWAGIEILPPLILVVFCPSFGAGIVSPFSANDRCQFVYKTSYVTLYQKECKKNLAQYLSRFFDNKFYWL